MNPNPKNAKPLDPKNFRVATPEESMFKTLPTNLKSMMPMPGVKQKKMQMLRKIIKPKDMPSGSQKMKMIEKDTDNYFNEKIKKITLEVEI